jgi:polygalacturonase
LLALGAPSATAAGRVFDVLQFGAVGDGVALDSPAIQRAIEAAAKAGGGAEVLLPRHHRYLTGTLELRGGIDFHLEGDLLISTNRTDYRGDGVITASNAVDLKISGSGSIQGRSLAFMTNYDPAGEWWLFGPWRVKMFLLTGCTNLEIRDITFGDAPYWGLHLLGCKNVVVDRLTITNRLDVPNCDGIGPDHCQDVKIRRCHITSGDDCIVIKSTRQTNGFDYGPCANITVSDCVLQTQDSGLKIGTETTSDIHDILFERCRIVSASRGLTIQLRDEGSVYNVKFRDIQFVSRYFSDPWWGRGEAISLTALPRTVETRLGTMHDITIQNVTGRAENSVRIQGFAGSRIRDVRLESVRVTLGRWTRYAGGLFDNRPTKALEPIEAHGTPGFNIRNADHITLKNCEARWGGPVPDYFTHALETENVTDLRLTDFKGRAAHPARDAAVVIH